MTLEEFIEKLKELGYTTTINQSEFKQFSYKDYYINLKSGRVWINQTGTTIHQGLDREIKYKLIIKRIIDKKWYNVSLVRNEKLNNILE